MDLIYGLHELSGTRELQDDAGNNYQSFFILHSGLCSVHDFILVGVRVT